MWYLCVCLYICVYICVFINVCVYIINVYTYMLKVHIGLITYTCICNKVES